MSRPPLLALVVALAACKDLPDPCREYPGETCFALEIDRAPGVDTPVNSISLLAISGFTITGASTRYFDINADFPLLVAVVPASLTARTVQLRVEASDPSSVGSLLEANASIMVQEGTSTRARILLAPAGAIDMSLPSNTDLAGADLKGGGLPFGAVCSNVSQCVADSSCYAYFGLALCRQNCVNDNDCDAIGVTNPANISHCTVAPTAAALANACTVPCNPVPSLGASGCAGGLLCYVYNVPSITPEVTNCVNAGSGAEGSTCTATTQCSAGQTCVGSGTLRCRANCRKGNDGDCTGGFVCKDITNRSMFGACCPTAGC